MPRNKLFIQLFLGLAFIILTTACSVNIAQDPKYTNPETLHLIWNANADSAISGAPVTVKDIVVVIHDDGKIQAIDNESGENRWHFETPAKLWPKSLNTTLDDVLIAGEDGRLIAMTTRSGLSEWELFLDGEVISSPLIDRYLIFAATSLVSSAENEDGDQEAELLAINASTGKILWRYVTDNETLVTPARGGDQVYVGGNAGDTTNLYALSAADGTKRWGFAAAEGAIKAIYANDDAVVILGEQGTLTALDGVTGFTLWRAEFVANISWLMGDEEFVIFEDGAAIQAWDINTGDLVWDYQIPHGVLPKPIVWNSELYLLTQAGEIVNLNLRSGKESWRFQTESNSPAGMTITDSAIFIADKDGYLYAYSDK
ncbi:MAG: PQQ-binding-like beta-propeller repeat protein [Anaerolineales bacterium]|nr:PQQ-binding-like beta-propeller repeat protein [Chloroflexota bacterium]MBL6981639.1 PQQ-binding-like beta-propeller repeat protein [Anaerolineales bacterium]